MENSLLEELLVNTTIAVAERVTTFINNMTIEPESQQAPLCFGFGRNRRG